jgi:hypothetical protein
LYLKSSAKEKNDPVAILNLLPADFSGVGVSELWSRAVEDWNILFGQSINQSKLMFHQTCCFSNRLPSPLGLSHVIHQYKYQTVSIDPSNFQAVLPGWFENNILMVFKLL